LDACLFHCKYPGISNARIFTEEEHNHDGTGLSQVALNAIQTSYAAFRFMSRLHTSLSNPQ
ncbi:hypothetical protein J5H80_20290, partial [Escherichia coli]|uniref:hypothetical protein n=1 Tax=Escherichia coli TaxID=562 RepID=UPI00225250A6